MKSMFSAVFAGPGKPLSLEQRPVPQIVKDDDVILKVGGVGICGSDLGILEGPHEHPAKPGVIFGHEFCGVVEEVGPAVKNLKPGQRVCVDQNPGCGRCHMCRQGLPNACIPLFDNPLAPEKGWPNTPGQWWDGGLAEFVKVPSYYLYEIADHVPMSHAAIFEPIGVVVNAMSKVKPQVGEIGVVMGGGPVGLFAVALMRQAGVAKIIASEISAYRRDLLIKCGADIVVDPSKEDLISIVMRETNNMGVPVIFECVGTQLPVALKLASFGGRIAQVGNPSRELTFRPFEIFAMELQIFGTFLMKNAMNHTISILEHGLLPLDTIITHIMKLEEINDAIELARGGNAGKIVILPNEL